MFGSSICLCLGVCLVLFGIFGYLISVKLNEQNEKIKNMVDLIYTITNDLQLLKLQQPPSTSTTTSTTQATQQLENSQSSVNSINHNFVDKLHTDLSYQLASVGIQTTETKKIVVSDCENYSSDEDEDDDEDDDDEDDEPEEDTDNDDDENDEHESDEVNDDVDGISYISENAPYEVSSTKKKEVVELLVVEPITVNVSDNDVTTSTTIHLDLEDMSSFDKSTDLLIDETSQSSSESVKNTKTIIIDLTNDSPDYNKMSIKELRKLAIERKLIDASSKAKKSDILKLL